MEIRRPSCAIHNVVGMAGIESGKGLEEAGGGVLGKGKLKAGLGPEVMPDPNLTFQANRSLE